MPLVDPPRAVQRLRGQDPDAIHPHVGVPRRRQQRRGRAPVAVPSGDEGRAEVHVVTDGVHRHDVVGLHDPVHAGVPAHESSGMTDDTGRGARRPERGRPDGDQHRTTDVQGLHPGVHEAAHRDQDGEVADDQPEEPGRRGREEHRRLRTDAQQTPQPAPSGEVEDQGGGGDVAGGDGEADTGRFEGHGPRG
ncbi:hypothetical protein [Blastococcus sp. PRF04-17]|uniref:hypothetical protein n=1 Tax=Blastococcus sp. PRF04-17 TaxID=2933797 RepID=UPI001FF4FF98|nr:hypothetical protein [Blastococcus sp. PRF04-17]UOY01561.1 hypothetical protein MVA48_21965 [Blastococcus sp. PRF04-17]